MLFDVHQRLRISLPPMDTTIAAEVISLAARSVHIRLREPIIGLEPRHLAKGVQISFWRDGGWHVADPVRVLTFDLDAGTIQLATPQKTVIVQRRQAFRENIEVPVHLASMDEQWLSLDIGDETADLAAQSGHTQDLSGGGLCLQTEEPTLFVDQEVRLEIELPDNRIQARGKVRWADRDDEGHGRYGIMFTRISEREQDLVYGFLFGLQRDRLRTTLH